MLYLASLLLYMHLLFRATSPPLSLLLSAAATLLPSPVSAARQPYSVGKIIEAFRQPNPDLIILCAHRGLRWNGTAENSRDAYFRAAEAGIECIETDIQLASDGALVMVHDKNLGRTTDVGERDGREAYNPFTGLGYDPPVRNLSGPEIQALHLRDEGGRTRVEKVPLLTDMVEMVRDSGLDVVLQLDFKDERAIEPAYRALKTLKNAKGVPANEWCIYKLQTGWYHNASQFEALPWVQDAFATGTKLAFIPVFDPANDDSGEDWDYLAGLKSFVGTNYTISVEIERRSADWKMQDLYDFVRAAQGPDDLRTFGIFFAGGDLVAPIASADTFWDTANFTLPQDARANNSAFVFQEKKPPQLFDWIVGNLSADGHDYRQDFNWILTQGHNWIIADNADEWHARLESQGKRNVGYLIEDGKTAVDPKLAKGWYRRWTS